MRLIFRFGRTLVFGLAFATLWAPGCSNQGEGDRCDSGRNGDQDCEPPLICVSATDLNDKATDRCCPQPGAQITDDRCQPAAPGSGGSSGDAGTDAPDGAETGTGGTAGASGSAGQGGTSGSGGSDAGTCKYNSDCPGTLVCGPTGVCQLECVNNKDCALGQHCNTNTNTCELDVSDAGGD